MEFLVISDTHTKHNEMDIPKTDLLVFAGDANVRSEESYFEFIKWFSKQDAKYKIFIPGNHDKYCELNQNLSIFIGAIYGVYVLIDEEIELEGCRIYGSPFTPTFYDWSFMLNQEDMKEKWKSIPEGLDLLVTHGPPLGILDLCPGGNVGCPELLEAVTKNKPKYHVFGHIHESYGVHKTEDTTFINGSVLDGRYRFHTKPIQGGII